MDNKLDKQECQKDLTLLYGKLTGKHDVIFIEPDPVMDNLLPLAKDISDSNDILKDIELMCEQKPWVAESIIAQDSIEPMGPFSRGSILLAYYLAGRSPGQLKESWPFLPESLRPVYTGGTESGAI